MHALRFESSGLAQLHGAWRVLCYDSPTQRHARDGRRQRLLRSLTFRALAAGVALKAAAILAGLTSVVPVVLLRGLDRLGDAGLVMGLVGIAALGLSIARRRLLWRVRRQLILSYVFIGVIPALLLVSFFVLAGILLFANMGSYLVQTRVRALTEEARSVANEVGRAMERATSPEQAKVVLLERLARLEAAFPGASVVVLPRDGRCDDAKGGGTWGDAVVAGTWSHRSAPTSLPPWVPCEGVAALVAPDTAPAQPRIERSAARAVAPLRADTWATDLVVDLPLSDALLRRLGEDTGTQIGTMVTLPAAEGSDANRSTAVDELDATGRSSDRLTDVLRWVAFVDVTNWETGRRGAVGLTMGLGIRRLYARVSATPLAGMGAFDFGQLVLAGLLIVAGLFLVIQSVAFVMGLVLARSITGSVHELFEGTERVRSGDFSHTIVVHRRDQLGELAESFNSMTASIDTLLREREEKQRLEQELAVARRIQMSLLPQDSLRLPGIVVAGHCEPAREVGGDYYDFLALGEGRAGLLVADVAGKGASAALYMAELKGVVHSLSRSAASPRDLLIEANAIIAPHLDERSFITMTYAVVDSHRRTFTYARAGHCPLVYLPGPARRSDGTFEPGAHEREAQCLAPSGMMLGLKLDGGTMFANVLEEQTLHLDEGSLLVLFTDGISEAMSEEGECFGEHRLARLVEAHRGVEVDALRELILDDIRRFSGSAPQHDDMTMLVLKVSDTSPHL